MLEDIITDLDTNKRKKFMVSKKDKAKFEK